MRLWNFGDKTECFRMFSEKLYNAHNGSDSPTTIKRIVYFNFYRFCNINNHIHRTYKLSKISLRQHSSPMYMYRLKYTKIYQNHIFTHARSDINHQTNIARSRCVIFNIFLNPCTRLSTEDKRFNKNNMTSKYFRTSKPSLSPKIVTTTSWKMEISRTPNIAFRVIISFKSYFQR